MADPLTSVTAMIAAIEPGERMINTDLLRQLYILVGDQKNADAVEPGYRLVDTALLRQLALRIGATHTSEAFKTPGPRLVDGTPWKTLSRMVTGEISPHGLEPAEAEPEPQPRTVTVTLVGDQITIEDSTGSENDQDNEHSDE